MVRCRYFFLMVFSRDVRSNFLSTVHRFNLFTAEKVRKVTRSYLYIPERLSNINIKKKLLIVHVYIGEFFNVLGNHDLLLFMV